MKQRWGILTLLNEYKCFIQTSVNKEREKPKAQRWKAYTIIVTVMLGGVPISFIVLHIHTHICRTCSEIYTASRQTQGPVPLDKPATH